MGNYEGDFARLFLAVVRQLSVDCPLWADSQHCCDAPGDKLGGGFYLFIGVCFDVDGVSQRERGAGSAGDGRCIVGDCRQCGGGFLNDYVFVQIYDLWLCPFLCRVFSACPEDSS